jgi:hypothetical protein
VLLPLICGLVLGVNVLDVVLVHLVDAVYYPSALDLDGCG